MQDAYAGDIGDYGKYGLLLCGLTVPCCWNIPVIRTVTIFCLPTGNIARNWKPFAMAWHKTGKVSAVFWNCSPPSSPGKR